MLPAYRFPPLLDLGGEPNFAAYQARFDLLYRSGEIRDVWNRLVLFDEERCAHVCFKEPAGSKHGKKARVWAPERAARLEWIRIALTTPDSIHPSHTMQGRQIYLVEGNMPTPSGAVWQQFIVCVEPETSRRAQKVDFITAFPPDTPAYWKAVKNKPPRLYPASKHRGRTRY